jgi:predicted DNA-binding transcriptional regulator AlpA
MDAEEILTAIERATVAEYLDTADAAVYLGISKSRLEGWRCKGRDGGPPYVRISARIIRYKRSEIDAWALERSS